MILLKYAISFIVGTVAANVILIAGYSLGSFWFIAKLNSEATGMLVVIGIILSLYCGYKAARLAYKNLLIE